MRRGITDGGCSETPKRSPGNQSRELRNRERARPQDLLRVREHSGTLAQGAVRASIGFSREPEAPCGGSSTRGWCNGSSCRRGQPHWAAKPRRVESETANGHHHRTGHDACLAAEPSLPKGAPDHEVGTY